MHALGVSIKVHSGFPEHSTLPLESATVFHTRRCHRNRGKQLFQRRPKHTMCNLGVCRQAEVSPLVSNRHLSRSPFDVGHTVFRLPAELIVETLAYFGDPHHNVIFAKKTRGAHSILDPDDVERLTVIRILTMTCWHLRNMLFPLLWKYVEGCNVSYRHMQQRSEWGGNGLYAQCTYLVLNPTISAYVQCVCSFIHEKKFTKCRSIELYLWIYNLGTLRKI